MSEQQILPANAPAPRFANAEQALGGRINGALSFLKQPAVARALPAVALTGVLGLTAAAWLALQSPAQAPLYAGLAEADKSAVAEALQASGIGYSLDPASGALAVDADRIHEARMMLAGQGLPKAQPSGDAMLASLPMGASRAIEGETLRAAREADLARTIEAIDAVKVARVHLALSQPSVFVREEKPAAASVLLTLQQGRSLGEAQVRAIRHLVASSVPGMPVEQVSVIDQSGALLSGVENGDSALLDLQGRIEARYREALIGLLTPVLGRDNFSVEVNADVDVSESQSTRESFPENSRALTREEGSNSRSNNAGTPAMGIGAVLVSMMAPEIAAQALADLPADRQADLLWRAARLGPVQADAIDDLEALLAEAEAVSAKPESIEIGGHGDVAKIVNSLPRPAGEELLKLVRKKDKQLAAAIEDEMFVFEDLNQLDAKSLGAVLRGVEAATLALALKGADGALADRFLATMSARAADTIRDELAEMAPVKREEVEAARKAIVAAARAMAASGEIMLGGKSDDYV